jgi:polygalacturonase
MSVALWLFPILFLGAAPDARDFVATDFGAVADGKTDCAEAIQKALDAAGKAGGGRVVLPAAKEPYLVGKTISVRFSNIHLSAKGATVQLASDAAKGSRSHVLEVGSPTAAHPIANVSIAGLVIDANFWNQQGAVEKKWVPRGLVASNVRGLLVDDVHVRRAWVSLAFSAGAEDCEARDCTVSQWHNDGFDAADGAGNIRFVRCRAFDAMSQRHGGPPGSRDSGWEIEDGAHDITLTDCVVEKTDTGVAFKVRSHNTPTVLRDVRFVRCKALEGAGRSWSIEGRDHDTRTQGVFLEDCEAAGELRCVRGADQVKITGGRFRQVQLVSPRRVHIAGSQAEKIVVVAEPVSDGKETFCADVTLDRVKFPAGGLTITGDSSRVKMINP